MRLLVPAGVWEIFIPDLADGENYKFEIRTHDRRDLLQEDRSVRRRVRGAAADGVDRARHLAATRGGTTAWMAARARARRVARAADVDLRSAPRIVGARARGGQPLPDLSRAGATGSCRT